MTEVQSLNSSVPTAERADSRGHVVTTVTAYTGLHLEPPTKDVVSNKFNNIKFMEKRVQCTPFIQLI